MMCCVLRNQKRGQIEHHLFGEDTTLIHLCVWLKGEKAAKNYRQAAIAKDLLKTKLTNEDAKLKTILWWISHGSTTLSACNRHFSSFFPPIVVIQWSHFIWRMKRNLSQEKLNVGESNAQLQVAQVSSALVPPCASYLELPATVGSLTTCWENSIFFDTHIYNRKTTWI